MNAVQVNYRMTPVHRLLVVVVVIVVLTAEVTAFAIRSARDKRAMDADDINFTDYGHIDLNL